jgi:hypothetical protein
MYNIHKGRGMDGWFNGFSDGWVSGNGNKEKGRISTLHLFLFLNFFFFSLLWLFLPFAVLFYFKETDVS